MTAQKCPHCGAQVIPTDMGRCPSCREMFAANPYAAPGHAPLRELPAADGSSFSQQAAKFSALAPLVILFLGMCLASQPAEDDRRSVVMAIGLINFLIMTLGVIFGVIGFIGGIRRRWWGTVTMAVIGLVLNGLLILSVVAAFQAVGKAKRRWEMEQEAKQRAPAEP